MLHFQESAVILPEVGMDFLPWQACYRIFFKPLTGCEVQNAMDWHWIFLIAPTCALFFSSTFPDSAIFRCSSASILSTRYERNCEKNRKCPPLDPARDYLYPPWPGRGEQCAVASWFLIFRVKVSFRFYSAFHWKVMKRFMIVWSRSVLTLWCQEFKIFKTYESICTLYSRGLHNLRSLFLYDESQ